MRENLFRGKCVETGEWVYGCLLSTIDNEYCCIIDDFEIVLKGNTSFPRLNRSDGYLEAFVSEVDPETVGQYTGMKDKNGNRIFEGDIFLYQGLFKAFPYVIEYDANCGVWAPFGDSDYSSNPKTVEIIGNIYDNSELLKEK